MIVFNTDSNTSEEQNEFPMNFYAAKYVCSISSNKGIILFLKTEIDENPALHMTVIPKNSIENTNSTVHSDQPTEV